MSSPSPPPGERPGSQWRSQSQSQSQSQSSSGSQSPSGSSEAPRPGAPYGVGAGHTGIPPLVIAGFVLSLVGLFPGFWFWWRQLPAYLGTLFSVVGLKATRGRPRQARSLAIAGLVIGIVGVVAAVLLSIYVFTSDSCDVENPFEFSCTID